MRDLMFLVGFAILLPLAASNAMVAYLIWGWTALISPDSYLFGFMADLRFNLIFGLITFFAISLKIDTVRARFFPPNSITILLSLLLFQATMSAVFAYRDNPLNWELYTKLAKIILFAVLMPILVVGRYRIHAMILVLCIGIGFHGVVNGLKFIASGGTHVVQGITKFGDNNHFAVITVMVIPLLWYISRYSNKRIIRIASVLSALMCVAAVVGTHSRGGIIALATTIAWMTFSNRKQFTAFLMLVAGILLIITLAPSDWFNRMETLQSAQTDDSFLARIEAWQVSSAIALRNPLTGGGLHAVQIQSVWERFIGDKGLLPFIDIGYTSSIFRAAHSIYFEILGDMGFIGLILLMAVLISGIRNSFQLSAIVVGREQELRWSTDLSKALTSSIVGFMIGGLTVSIAYSEPIYIVVMLSEILRRDAMSIAALDRHQLTVKPQKQERN